MSKKVCILFLSLAFGFFLIPNTASACGNNTLSTTHKKEVNSQKKEKDSCKKDCCNKDSDSKTEKNCGGKCGHTNCTTSSFQLNIPASNDFELPVYIFNFSIEKPISYYNEAGISDGYTSIWLPPKIK